MDTKNCFQARLLRTRVARRLSQSALAKTVGITPAQISRYEAGENFPRPHIVAQLAKALGVEAEWLAGTASEDLAPPPYAAIDMPGDSGFADRMRQARIASELSQTDLAVAAGIASAQISRYESGRNYPRPHIIAKLASALGVTADWLTGDEPQNEETFDLEPELHLPLDLRNRLLEAASTSGRSYQEEVIDRLEESLEGPRLGIGPGSVGERLQQAKDDLERFAAEKHAEIEATTKLIAERAYQEVLKRAASELRASQAPGDTPGEGSRKS